MIEGGKVSLGDIAARAGVSRAAASYALRNMPGVSEETRARILAVAKELNYAPDARIDAWMTRLRESKNRELLPIAWFNHHLAEKNAWTKFSFLSPYYKGAVERASELGYRLELIWTNEPNLSTSRLSKILFSRGVQGVVVTHFVRRFELDWKHFAAVSLEGTLVSPRLNRIMTDHYANYLLAVNSVTALGCRRIGVCFSEDLDATTDHAIRAMSQYQMRTRPKAERVEPLFYPWGGRNEPIGAKQVIAWLKRHRPEVVIGLSNRLVEWCASAGLRVPEDIGVVHIATDDDVSDWAGVCSNRREIGAQAVTLLVSQIHNRRFGVPKLPSNLMIRGTWKPGWTLNAAQTALC